MTVVVPWFQFPATKPAQSLLYAANLSLTLEQAVIWEDNILNSHLMMNQQIFEDSCVWACTCICYYVYAYMCTFICMHVYAYIIYVWVYAQGHRRWVKCIAKLQFVQGTQEFSKRKVYYLHIYYKLILYLKTSYCWLSGNLYKTFYLQAF